MASCASSVTKPARITLTASDSANLSVVACYINKSKSQLMSEIIQSFCSQRRFKKALRKATLSVELSKKRQSILKSEHERHDKISMLHTKKAELKQSYSLTKSILSNE
jgi:hypothetical protein